MEKEVEIGHEAMEEGREENPKLELAEAKVI